MSALLELEPKTLGNDQQIMVVKSILEERHPELIDPNRERKPASYKDYQISTGFESHPRISLFTRITRGIKYWFGPLPHSEIESALNIVDYNPTRPTNPPRIRR